MPVIRVYVEDELLSFEGESILFVDAEELWRSSTTPPRLLLRVDEEGEPPLEAEDLSSM